MPTNRDYLASLGPVVEGFQLLEIVIALLTRGLNSNVQRVGKIVT